MPARLRFSLLLCLSLVGLGALAGCAAQVAMNEPAGLDLAPDWQRARFAEHVRVLNAPDVESRGTGTIGLARAAAYVASEMTRAGLQPAMGHDFRTTYPVPIQYPLGASLRAATPDTTYFANGHDFLLDGRSDSARVRIETLAFAASPSVILQAPAGTLTQVALPSQDLDTETLTALSRAGVRTLLLVGPLAPVRGLRSIQNLAILQVRTRVLATAFDLPSTAIEPLLASNTALQRRLRYTLRLRAVSQYDPRAQGVNVLGYLPGKHPVRRNDLILVCADLDAMGRIGGVPTVAPEHLGSGAAALLEVAHHQGELAQYASLPGETLLFALWSGAHQGAAGIRAYLSMPSWPMDSIRTILYVGQSEVVADQLRTLGATYGIEVRALVRSPSNAPRLAPWVAPLTPAPMAQAITEERLPAAAALAANATDDAIYLAEALHIELNRLLLSPELDPLLPPPQEQEMR